MVLIDSPTPHHRLDPAPVERPRREAPAPRLGDLLFGNRRSPVQALQNLAKDPWTHCAVVGRVEGELRAIEMGPAGCFSRPIEEFRAAYRVVGHVRPSMGDACREAVASSAELHLVVGDLEYSWDVCGLVGTCSLARGLAPARWEPTLIDLAAATARRLARRWGPHRVSCSGFVELCLASACSSCAPPPRWPQRPRTPIWRAMSSFTELTRRVPERASGDPLVVRTLTNPSDLWVCGRWEWQLVSQGEQRTLIDDPHRATTPCLRTPSARTA